MSNRICYAADGSFDFPSNVLRHYRQVILNKRTSDPFDEPRIERLLTELHPSEFLVMGATAEGAVKSTVLGLLQRGKKVSVITDAVGYLDYHEAEMAIRKIHAKGAGLLESREIAGESHLKKGKECECEICQNCDKILSPAKI
jgi:nicotinamidase-related amidase